MDHRREVHVFLVSRIVTTGTPPGVGRCIKPQPFFLKPGDVMTPGIEGLGEQRQEVIAWQRTARGLSNGL